MIDSYLSCINSFTGSQILFNEDLNHGNYSKQGLAKNQSGHGAQTLQPEIRKSPKILKEFTKQNTII